MADSNIVSGLKTVFPSVTREADVNRFSQEVMDWINAAAITGTTALGETPIGAAKLKSRLVGLVLTPGAAVTANGTNFLSLIFRKRTAAVPGTQVGLVSFVADTPTTDDLVAFAARDILTSVYKTAAADTDFNFAQDDVLTVELTKTGTGLTLPICSVRALFEPRE